MVHKRGRMMKGDDAKHAKTSDSSEPDDVEEPNESWNEVSSYIFITYTLSFDPFGFSKYTKSSKKNLKIYAEKKFQASQFFICS